MKSLRRLMCLLFLATGSPLHSQPSEIDSFIKGFNPMSLNGKWPGVDLPETAPVEKVVETFVETQKRTVDAQQYDGYRIVEIRKPADPGNSWLKAEGYTIVQIASHRGGTTVLLLNCYFGSGWKVRPYFITTVP